MATKFENGPVVDQAGHAAGEHCGIREMMVTCSALVACLVIPALIAGGVLLVIAMILDRLGIASIL